MAEIKPFFKNCRKIGNPDPGESVQTSRQFSEFIRSGNMVGVDVSFQTKL